MALDTAVGGASSDSYASVAEFDVYAAALGWTVTATEAAKEAALRRGRVYLDSRYQWKGAKATREQALQWPRLEVYDEAGWYVDSDTIPKEIKDAQCELAYSEISGTSILPQKEGAKLSETVKAGPVGVTTNYGAAPSSPRFGTVDGLVRQYVLGSGLSRIVRG